MRVLSNCDKFEYDILSLAKVFYPHENVSFEADDGASSPDSMRITWEDEQGHVRVCMDDVSVCDAFCPDDRTAAKSAVKRCIYNILSKKFDRQLPWGCLTGIRPTKLAMAMLEGGVPEDGIADSLKREHLVTDGKAFLALDIAKREKALLNAVDCEGGYSLYAGIPFCPSTCLYCSFTSYPIGMYKARVDEYLDCLQKELEYTASAFAGRHLDTVYVGGGTPTTLSPAQLDRLLFMFEGLFDMEHVLELTVEAGRPDSVTEEKLDVLKAHGVSRISINPQTMNDKTLRIIGRNHTSDQITDVFRMARAKGFKNINMDIILGLPNEAKADVEYTLKAIEALAPDNLTVHSLALKRAARLNIERDAYSSYTYENSQEIMDLAYSYARKMGMEPYYLYRQKNMAGDLENVGFAKKGMAGLYNILIMEEKQTIAAVGAGSTSKRIFSGGRIERSENVKDVSAYIRRIDEMIERKRRLFEE